MVIGVSVQACLYNYTKIQLFRVLGDSESFYVSLKPSQLYLDHIHSTMLNQ